MTGNIGLFLLVLWPFAGAFFSYLIGRKSKRVRDYFANFVTITVFLAMAFLAFKIPTLNSNPLEFKWPIFASFGIHFKLDGFRYIYATITALMWMMTTLFSREYFRHYRNRNRYYFFMLMTLGGTLGVFLSGNLVTTFMFFEMMSFTSYVMVVHDESPKAMKAGDTYMAVAVLGGLAMLMGILILNFQLGTTDIDQLMEAAALIGPNKHWLYLSAAFLLVGFGGKAGMWPLHIWLPNAHPVAPAPASALLSGVLTKTGIFGILVVSVRLFFHEALWGNIILVIGVIGMFTGAFLAVFSIDLKRTLALSSMSQIGFILVGVGMQGVLGHHNALAVRGTLLHMVNHSLIKLVLFMMAGVVYMNLHQLDLNKIRGFGRGKPGLIFPFLMGVLGIIGLPMWNGYISKTLLHESIVEQIWLFQSYAGGARFYQTVESIFTLTGGLTTAYMIKIFVAVCIERNQEGNQEKFNSLRKTYMNKTTAFALISSAIILPLLGFFSDFMLLGVSQFGQGFMFGEEPAHAVELLAWINLRGAVASLSIGAIVYILIVRGCLMTKDAQGRSVYVNRWPKYIDLENYIYRPLLLRFLPFVGATVSRIIGSFVTAVSELGYKVFARFRIWWGPFASKVPKLTNELPKAQGQWKDFTDKIPTADAVVEKSRSGWESATSKIPTADAVVEKSRSQWASATNKIPTADAVVEKQRSQWGLVTDKLTLSEIELWTGQEALDAIASDSNQLVWEEEAGINDLKADLTPSPNDAVLPQPVEVEAAASDEPEGLISWWRGCLKRFKQWRKSKRFKGWLASKKPKLELAGENLKQRFEDKREEGAGKLSKFGVTPPIERKESSETTKAVLRSVAYGLTLLVLGLGLVILYMVTR